MIPNVSEIASDPKLGANERVGMPLADRAAELAAVAAHFRNPGEREDFAARAFKSIWRGLDVSLTAASQALERSQAETHELRQRCESEAQELRQRFEADLRNLTVRIGELNSELSGVYASAQSIAEQRDTTLAAYRQVVSSKSWAVTKPLRWGKQKLL